MSDAMDAHPLDAVGAMADQAQEEQRRLVDEAIRERHEALKQLTSILVDARLIHSLHHFQREYLGDYSRVMQYFGTTPQYDPRRPMAGDYAMFLELQWSDEPIDFGMEDTPPGCFTIQLHVSAGDGDADSVAFPTLFQRVTRSDWEREPDLVARALYLAYDHVMHSGKRTTRAYRFPWGIQTIYNIEML